MKPLLEQYRETPYVTDIPDDWKSRQRYKFESPYEFVSFIEKVDASGNRGSRSNDSDTNDSGWAGAPDVKSAIQKFRETVFDPEEAKKASRLIAQNRPSSKYMDEGEEISIPEYLAKGDYFMKYDSKKSKKRMFITKNPIFINCVYNAGNGSADALKTAINIVKALYILNVRTPKIVMCFASKNQFHGYNETERGCGYTFVEIDFVDFNAVSKMLLPSTFRRMMFRLWEMHTNLNGGYGQTMHFNNDLKTCLEIERMIGWSEEQTVEYIKTKLEEASK